MNPLEHRDTPKSVLRLFQELHNESINIFFTTFSSALSIEQSETQNITILKIDVFIRCYRENKNSLRVQVNNACASNLISNIFKKNYKRRKSSFTALENIAENNIISNIQ